ncbi:hypothetical protein HanXRQr2_Chr04g0167601 [Helianthus annuus]|uniref:Uncharacterized protein n=1 Tax=Helianthus annuus TaxID=4232 RepID=A0A9K3J7M3_HELAN|nr:hypothetical protein HanXRQr2_Chr04g0167601 [Helianthus annuus]KAJ0931399.1 hypothetical protein HanPSC8_Chr04g0161221 [Helianthus annuus]
MRSLNGRFYKFFPADFSDRSGERRCSNCKLRYSHADTGNCYVLTPLLLRCKSLCGGIMQFDNMVFSIDLLWFREKLQQAMMIVVKCC